MGDRKDGRLDPLADTAPLFGDPDFQRLPDDLSDTAKAVLSRLTKQGFLVRRSQTEPVVVVSRDGQAWRLRSNFEVEEFGQSRAPEAWHASPPATSSSRSGNGMGVGILIGVFGLIALFLGYGVYEYQKAKRFWDISIPSVSQTNDWLRQNLPGSWTGEGAPAPPLSSGEIGQIRDRLVQCWSPPVGWSDPSEVRVVLQISLRKDGALSGEPTVVERPSGGLGTMAVESALRAVRRCAPFVLPAEKYEAWRQVRITLVPAA